MEVLVHRTKPAACCCARVGRWLHRNGPALFPQQVGADSVVVDIRNVGRWLAAYPKMVCFARASSLEMLTGNRYPVLSSSGKDLHPTEHGGGVHLLMARSRLQRLHKRVDAPVNQSGEDSTHCDLALVEAGRGRSFRYQAVW